MARKTVYNDVVNSELWDQVNKDNKYLLDEFVKYLNGTDKSSATIVNYISDLRICFVWSLQFNNNKSFDMYTKRDFINYQGYLVNDLLLSSNRVRRLRSTMSSLANFIETILDDEYPNFRNIVNKIPAPVKEAVRDKTILTEEQLESLLKYLVDRKEYQKACILALASASGARKSELPRFKVDYFKEENIIYDALYKTYEKIKTKGFGKKGKPLFKYALVKQFKPYLDLWLAERELLGVESEWLFVANKDNKWIQLPVSTMDCWADNFTKFLGVDFYFHCLRHFFTTFMYRSGLPSEVIKDIVGWSNVSMVGIYLDIEADEEIGKYFDKDGIKKIKKKELSDL